MLENGGVSFAKIAGLQLFRTIAGDGRLLQSGSDECGQRRCANRVVVPRLLVPYELVSAQVKAEYNLRICGGHTLAYPQCRYRNCSVARPSTRSGTCYATNLESVGVLLPKVDLTLPFSRQRFLLFLLDGLFELTEDIKPDVEDFGWQSLHDLLTSSRDKCRDTHGRELATTGFRHVVEL